MDYSGLVYRARFKKNLIRYLENRLVEIAHSSNSYKVFTKNTYKNKVMKESQISAMEEYIENIKALIDALGYKVLEPFVVQNANGKADDASEEFFLSAVGGVSSGGYECPLCGKSRQITTRRFLMTIALLLYTRTAAIHCIR